MTAGMPDAAASSPARADGTGAPGGAAPRSGGPGVDPRASTVLTPVLTARWDEADSFTLAGYRRTGGYQALPKALDTDPDEIIKMVKESGLRGRGGAGLPDRDQVGLHPAGRREAALPGGER